MAGDAIIKLDMDTGPFDKKATEAGEKLKKVSANAPDFAKSVIGLGKMIVSAKVLAAAMGAAFEAYNKVSERQATNSEKAGAGHLTQGLAADRLGMSGNAVTALMTADGAGTMEVRDAVLAGMASMKRGGKEASKGNVGSALRLAASGLYSQDEIMKAANEGGLDQLLAGAVKRYTNLSDKGKEELGTRAKLFAEERAKLAAPAGLGNATRIAQARKERALAESPIVGSISEFAKNAVGAVPFLGPSVFKPAAEAVELGAFQAGTLLDEMQTQTELLERIVPRAPYNMSAGMDGAR
ncbi:MAG: hypothetical protein H0W72_06965 [Planctomycetes bacterium]|nr:hypothetical protein [Planctomycetota bacterium]